MTELIVIAVISALLLGVGRVLLRGFYLAVEAFLLSDAEEIEKKRKTQQFNILFIYYCIFLAVYIFYLAYILYVWLAPNPLQ